MREAQELAEPTEEYRACPLDDNLFEWHFTIQGPPSSEFADGVYHGRILLPPEYPMKPPNIILLTVSCIPSDSTKMFRGTQNVKNCILSSAFERSIIFHCISLFSYFSSLKNSKILWIQPNGRFEINKKICLSISGHHPETWQPSWSIRTALLALIAFMPTPGNDTIGSLDYSPEERQKLAKKYVHKFLAVPTRQLSFLFHFCIFNDFIIY